MTPTITCENVVANIIFSADQRVRLPKSFVRENKLVRIHCGTYLKTEWLIGATSDQIGCAVTIARAISVSRRTGHAIAADSALICQGVDVYRRNPEIHLLCCKLPGRELAQLPSVTVHGRVFPAVRVRKHVSASSCDTASIAGGASVVSTPDAIVTALQWLAAQEAFEVGCAGVFALAEGHKIRTQFQRDQAEFQLQVLRQKVADLPKHCPHGPAARQLVATISPGCESIGEIRTLWTLLKAGVTGMETQFEQIMETHQYFIDIAFPQVNVAIEFDGMSKYQFEDPMIARVQVIEEHVRQNNLTRAGWAFLRIHWHDLDDPTELVRQVRQLIAARQPRAPAQAAA